MESVDADSGTRGGKLERAEDAHKWDANAKRIIRAIGDPCTMVAVVRCGGSEASRVAGPCSVAGAHEERSLGRMHKEF